MGETPAKPAAIRLAPHASVRRGGEKAARIFEKNMPTIESQQPVEKRV
jgi:hypothetical protein